MGKSNTSTTRTLTFPDASGTFALTSDLASYQPLDSDLTTIAAANNGDVVASLTAADIERTEYTWESRAAVALATIDADVDALRTLGYTTPGDGGGALYKRVGSEPSHAGKVQSADGAWWEIAETIVTPAMFGGARNTAATDSIAAIEAAYAFSGNVKLDGFYYVGSGGVDLTAAGAIYAETPDDCGLKPVTGHTETTSAGLLNLKASGIRVSRITIDGDDRFRRGIYDDNGGNIVEFCDIKNIYSTTASTVGIFCDALAGSVYEGNTISEIESVGDVTTGNDNGASRAIQIFIAADATEKFKIINNKISRIIGEEGDGIQILAFASSVFYSSAGSIIDGNIITRCSKRAIKIQAHDVSVRDNHITMLADLGSDLYAGIDIIDSEDVRVTGNDVHVTSTVRGINTTGSTSGANKNPVVKNNRIKTDTSALRFAIVVNNFENAVVDGNDIEYGYIAMSNGDVISCRGNTGRNILASGTSSFVDLTATVTNGFVANNVVYDSTSYATVAVRGPNHVIIDNSRMQDGRCVYVVGSGAINNILVGNTTLSTTTAAVIYSGTTSGAQKQDVNNFNMA